MARWCRVAVARRRIDRQGLGSAIGAVGRTSGSVDQFKSNISSAMTGCRWEADTAPEYFDDVLSFKLLPLADCLSADDGA